MQLEPDEAPYFEPIRKPRTKLRERNAWFRSFNPPQSNKGRLVVEEEIQAETELLSRPVTVAASAFDPEIIRQHQEAQHRNLVARGLTLFVWDAPNMDMCASRLFCPGRAPKYHERPDMKALHAWLTQRADRYLEAYVFSNARKTNVELIRQWAIRLGEFGFQFIMKRKQSAQDDVDEEMLEQIEQRIQEGGIKEIILASHDGRNFAEPLERIILGGQIKVTILGYLDLIPASLRLPQIELIDLREVAGVFHRNFLAKHPLKREAM